MALYSEKRMREPWWQLFEKTFGWGRFVEIAIQHGGISHYTFANAFEISMTIERMHGGSKIYHDGFEKYCSKGTKKVLEDKLEELGFVLMSDSRPTYIHPRGIVLLDVKDLGTHEYIEFEANVADGEPVFDVVEKIVEERRFELPPKKHENPGYAYIMMESHGEVCLVAAEHVGIDLERKNYNSEQLDGFDRIVADIVSWKPSGRLSVLDGPPGTGKTYFIRGLMNAADQSKFIVVPPHMVNQLAEPRMIMTYLEASRNADGPLVLILEDADECLKNRSDGNMSLLSSILNLSDNILGHCLDLRIVASTNSPVSDLDPAVRRPGRLSAHIHFGKLSHAHAKELWKHFSPKYYYPFDSNNEEARPSLAEIYHELSILSDVAASLNDIERIRIKQEQEVTVCPMPFSG